jgi:hypothetical protein
MPGQFNTTRRQESLAVSASNKVSYRLQTGYCLREIILDLNLTTTTTGVTNIPGSLGRGDEWSSIARIELIADGETLLSISGVELLWLNYFRFGAFPQRVSTLGDGSTANPVTRSQLIIPLWSPDTQTPIDTQLDTSKYSTLRLDVTYAAATAVGASATAISGSLQVTTYEAYGLGGPFMSQYVLQREVALAAAVTRHRIPLDVGSHLFRGFLLNTRTSATETDNALLTEVQVVSGSTVIRDWDAVVLANYGRQRERVAFPTGARGGDVPFMASSLSVRSAWYWIDLCPDGYLSEAFNTRQISNVDLVVSSSAAARLAIIPIQIVPPIGK